MTKHYSLDGDDIDSVELKCLVVSKGVKIDMDVYKRFSKTNRLGVNPLMCNCCFLSDGTVVQLTDIGFHLKYLTGILSWNNLKLLKYASDLQTPFEIRMVDNRAALLHSSQLIDYIEFPPNSDFYHQKTSSGLPFLGNSVIQGVDWVAFQCLWPCEYAAAGKPCEFCFSGAEYEALARKGKPLPKPISPVDVAEIVDYAINKGGCNSIQITGGSTFDSSKERGYILSYLESINQKVGRDHIGGDILLYITPPDDTKVVDEYMAMGASRIACSIEVWDQDRAAQITPGKISFTTRQRHLDIMEYIAEKYGPGTAFSNFIIGIEPYESLAAGATYLAERGIIPTASIWMPMGRPVMSNMKTPDVFYYRKVKELFAELYQKYNLEPSRCCGMNVCMERDIWNFSLN